MSNLSDGVRNTLDYIERMFYNVYQTLDKEERTWNDWMS